MLYIIFEDGPENDMKINNYNQGRFDLNKKYKAVFNVDNSSETFYGFINATS